MLVCMNRHETAGAVPPELTLGWRLKMALDAGGVSALGMANHIGVTRQTVSRWMADKGSPPHRGYLIAWADATGVPLGWLESGKWPDPSLTPARYPEQLVGV